MVPFSRVVMGNDGCVGDECGLDRNRAVYFDDNRIFVELRFIRPDGTERKALAFVDLGTPQLMISENLRRELQVEQTKPVVFRVGGVEVKVDASAIATDSGFGMTGPDGKRTIPVEAVLGGSVMKNFVVTFDYGKQTLTFAAPDHFGRSEYADQSRWCGSEGNDTSTAGS